MLQRYQPNFESLTPEETALVARHIARVTRDENFTCDDGGLLFQRVSNMSMNHAQVVLAVAPDPSPEAVVALEKLVGRPIVREAMPQPNQRAPRVARDPNAPRASRRMDNRVIVSVAPNPKKITSASHARYELYKVGQTIDDFLRAGGTTADVNWDVDRGFVVVEAPGAAAEEASE